MGQANPRVEFNSKGVRPESIYALRWVLKSRDIEEGEFLSQLFDQAVVDLYKGAGPAQINILHDAYFREQRELEPK